MFVTLFAVMDVVFSNSLASCRLTPFPNADMNDGKDASSGPEPVVSGILEYRAFVGDSSFHDTTFCPQSDPTVQKSPPFVDGSLSYC